MFRSLNTDCRYAYYFLYLTAVMYLHYLKKSTVSAAFARQLTTRQGCGVLIFLWDSDSDSDSRVLKNWDSDSDSDSGP